MSFYKKMSQFLSTVKNIQELTIKMFESVSAPIMVKILL